MKLVSATDFNTNNGWGFGGGGYGVDYLFDNGWKLRVGTACTRHQGTFKFKSVFPPDEGRRIYDVHEKPGRAKAIALGCPVEVLDYKPSKKK